MAAPKSGSNVVVEHVREPLFLLARDMLGGGEGAGSFCFCEDRFSLFFVLYHSRTRNYTVANDLFLIFCCPAAGVGRPMGLKAPKPPPLSVPYV